MAKVLVRSRRYVLAALLVLLAAIGARAQAPEFGYWGQTPLPQQGLATYYNPGVMAEVLANRLEAGDIDPCPECVGTVALLRAGDIGRKVWLQPPGGEPVGPFQVIDCARRQDVQPLLDRNWVVDVSFEVGQYWGMNRPLDGVIVFEDPADAVPGRPVNRIQTPFAVAPEDVVISPPTATPEIVPEAGPPTAWPTRMPVPLVPQPQTTPPPPTVTPIPPTPTAIWPPPRTPIITTPTAVPTAWEGTAGEAGATGTQAATPTPTEVALGRAGAGLLALTTSSPTPEPEATAGPHSLSAPEASTAAPTARPTLARTPRPNLTPILSLPSTPTPTPAFDPNFFDRLLRDLLDLVR
jgi:hypothetical protein